MTDASARKAAAAAREPDAGDQCPLDVVCLGRRDGRYAFLTKGGEFVERSVRDLATSAGLLALVDGNPASLAAAYPQSNKGKVVPGEFNAGKALAGLMRRCAAAGITDPELVVRRYGVWRADNEIVVHSGDTLTLFKNGKPRTIAAGCHYQGAIYPALATVAHPARKPAEPALAREFMRGFELWTFDDVRARKLVFGWACSAFLGAATAWRVHVLATGEKGSGKTSMTAYVCAALGPQAYSVNDLTSAALRQSMSEQARAPLIDEVENSGNDAMSGIMALIRKTSTDAGLVSIRGTSGGTAQRFSVAASVWIVGINPPDLLPQDRSRIFQFDLKRPSTAIGADDKVRRAIEEASAMSPGLRARAAAGFGRFRDNLGVYRAALLARDCDQRMADKYATLLAAAEMMLSDEPVHSDIADEEIDGLADMLRAARVEDDEDSDASQCFTTLMTRQIEHWRGGSKSTIGRLVREGLEPLGAADRKALLVYGLKLHQTGAGWVLYVANRHETLRSVFRDTRWREGAWRTALLRLDGARPSPLPQRFDDHKGRCVGIPEKHLPIQSDDGERGDDPIS